MNRQYCNYTYNIGIHKGIRQHEMECKGTILNPLFPIMPEPLLVDILLLNMHEVNLRNNPMNKDSET